MYNYDLKGVQNSFSIYQSNIKNDSKEACSAPTSWKRFNNHLRVHGKLLEKKTRDLTRENLLLACSLVHNKTCTRGELTVYESDEVPS